MKFISLFFILSFTGTTQATTNFRVFNSDSYKTIINENSQPFVLLLWSLECPPCLKELSTLNDIMKSEKKLKFILISTDPISEKYEIKKILTKFDLIENENWIFSNEPEQKLRYSIDPDWYGELPRSYFYENINSRHTITGPIDKKTLSYWFNQLIKKH